MDQELIHRIRAGLDGQLPLEQPPADFAALPRIPPGRYSDRAFLQAEKERMWQCSWLYGCHTDQLPGAGSYLAWEKTGSPIVIVRGNDRKIRAFYNSCRHRGGPLVKDASGKMNGNFVCAFHGWAYNLEGHLVGVRDQKNFGELDFGCHALREIRCEQFGNWVFINEDSDAEPLTNYLGPIAAQWQLFDPDNTRHVASSSHVVECNCKTLMEAFLEVYHLCSVHAETVDRFLDYRASRIVLWPNGHSLMLTPHRNADWTDPGTRGMPRFSGAGDVPDNINVSYNIYPNLITPPTSTGIPFLVYWPLDETSAQIDCHWFSPDWGAGEKHELWDTRVRNFERILEEDLELAPYLQKSTGSPGYDGPRLSFRERKIYYWHEELDRRIGPDDIPRRLRVEPRMTNLVEDWP